MDDFERGLLRHTDHLRTVAFWFCRNSIDMEDLVQDTLVNALRYRDRYQEGTNLRAWLVTILRHRYFNDQKRAKLPQYCYYPGLLDDAIDGRQENHRMLTETFSGIAVLPPDMRDALVLHGVYGLTYDEAALVAGSTVGTMKSRTSRARAALRGE